MGSKKVDFDKLWAQYIYKRSFEGKDFLFAYVRKYHGYDDVVMDGEGEWLGIEEVKIPRMAVDTDENSETYQQRVPKYNVIKYQDGHEEKIPEIIGTRFSYKYEDNEKNKTRFKKLVKDTLQGSTRFTWCLRNRNYDCPYEADFWKSNTKEVDDQITRKKSIYVAPPEN